MKSRELATSEISNNKIATKDMGPFLKTKFNISSVSVKSLGNVVANSGNQAFANTGIPGVNTLTIGANTAPGEIIKFAGNDFTIVPGNPIKDGQVKLGVTTSETAQNLATAILNSPSKALKNYSIDINDANVIITQLSASGAVMPITASENITNVVTTQGTGGGLDVSGIKGFTASIKAANINFSLVSYVTGLSAKAEAMKYQNKVAIAPITFANDGDTAATYQVTIAGKVFIGSVYLPYGTLTVDNMVTKFINFDTNEHFLTTFGSANGDNLANIATSKAIATHFTSLFTATTFNQIQILDSNTDGGDVFDPTGFCIASLNGMKASLTSTSFANKKFTGFTIERVNGFDVKLSAKIMGPEDEATYTVTRTSGKQIGAMVRGFKLDLTDANSGDILTINLGEAGLTKLSDYKNHEAISWAFKSAILETVPLKHDFNELFCDLAKYVNRSDGSTKLLYLTPSKNSGAIHKFLIEQDVVFNSVYNQDGKIIAYRCESVDSKLGIKFAKFLISQKADVNHVNNQGQTAFSLAAQLGQTELIKFLVTKMDKTLIDRPDSNGFSPAMYAAANDSSICKILIENRPNNKNPELNSQTSEESLESYDYFEKIGEQDLVGDNNNNNNNHVFD